MSKIKYYYDTETCKFEKLKTSTSDVVINTLGYIILSLVFATGLLFAYNYFFQSPREQFLNRENKDLNFYYKIMNKEMNEMDKVLTGLQDKDDQVYRSIFETPPISPSIRNSGMGDMDIYRNLLDKNISQQDLILSTMDKLNRIKKKAYIQSKSYEEILALSKQKSALLAGIPAIQPMSNPNLTKLVSGFGYRMHPIYKMRLFHSGVDFSASKGTPVYATGDGVIITTARNAGGYGNEIEVNHGFGYVTKYAHLETFKVKVGQKVKRGELIGYSGSSGAATAPHLHYEVIHNGIRVNPVHYFFKGLNSEQYKKILELAEQENQSLS
ncbi:MAG TPA: M23 family metallopeptidase [Cytophagaceae bacterium]|jgi:murein DD-endopeptidase MepM/ murein hydrolase activator NlpD|nr:M23 family metallopeptidase [Cytophagaceae bacterium]